MPLESATEAPHRLVVFAGHLTTALRELRVTEHPGALSGVLAECCLDYLGPNELALLLVAAVQAADAADQERVWNIQCGLKWEDVK